MIFIILIPVVVWILCAYLSVDLRKKKGYDGGWAFGLLFGIMALIHSAGLPDLTLHNKVQQTLMAVHQQNNITSPGCNSEIKETQISVGNGAKHQWRCSNCGRMICEDICPFCSHKH